MVASTVVPTTRKLRTLVAPPADEDSDSAMRTVEPTRAPVWRIVFAPSTTSLLAAGGRPSTIVTRTGPRMLCPATASTTWPLMLTSPPTPAVMAAIPGRSRSSSSRAFCAAEPVLLTENDASNAWPYCAGVLVRWVRLAPNTPVPQRTATARTAPTRAELTGTAVRPRPRSRALRIPMSALGGAPDAVRKPTIRDERTTGSSSRRETSREARISGPDAQPEHRHDRQRSAPDQQQRVEVETRGRVGELCLAHGDEEGEQRSQEHPSGGTSESDRQRAGHGEGEQLTAGGAERAQDRVVVCLQCGLASQCLGQDDDADQGGQRSEDPPPDRLGVDGGGDGVGQRVEVGAREAPEGAHLGLEARKAGGTVAQAEHVLVEHDGLRVVLPGEAARGVEVVGGRARRRRELELGDREADHVQGDGRTSWGDVGVAQHRRPLGRGRQRDAQDAADVHAQRLEVVRGQHLVGVGLVRQATADQLDHLGQLRRCDLVDGEVVRADGVTVRTPGRRRRAPGAASLTPPPAGTTTRGTGPAL